MGCSCSESHPGSCSLELGLEELSSSNKQGMLWVVCPDAAETAGRPACSLPAPCQAAASLCLALRAFAPSRRVGWDWLSFLELILNPPLGSGQRFPWERVTVPSWDLGQGWVLRRGAPYAV